MNTDAFSLNVKYFDFGRYGCSPPWRSKCHGGIHFLSAVVFVVFAQRGWHFHAEHVSVVIVAY